MVEVREMSDEEVARLPGRGWYGRLGVTRDGHPYVVPMSYAYDAPDLYFFTTEGTKTEFIAANHEICFQVEEVVGPEDWQSVVLTGRAERIMAAADVESATSIISGRNPSLTPALNHTKIGSWTRLSHVVIYRLRPEAVYGRKTLESKG